MSTSEQRQDGIRSADFKVSTDPPSKSWVWGVIQRGDCTIEDGAVYTIFPDGTTHWVCNISSPNDNDAWLGFFRVYNDQGVALFDQGGYNFLLHSPNVVQRWDESQGPDDKIARGYGEATRTDFFCRC